nr:probable LRR receptor-like protein kinase At1g51890 [Arachis hypogaea]
MAKIITNSLFLLLGALSFVATIQGQDQSGFISIDCGLPENSNYTEKNTGINYISDANFIDSGVSKTVSPQDKTTHPQYFTYLRSFPYGTRNCYRINVTSVTRYLIRASFLYGNYDGLNKLPEFDLYLGVHFWDTVKFTNSSVSINYEIIHTLSTDYIHICMVNKGKGTSFISVIEMRILDNVNNTYTTQDPTTSLARFRRLDVGISNLTYRYEDDPYDRIWEPYWDDKWTQLSSGFSSDNLIQNDFKVPAVVMETAATPKNATASLDFQWEDDYADNNETQHQYYFYLHFAEFRKLEENQTSSFNISLNDVPWVRRELVYGIAYTRYTTSPLFGHKNFHISIIRAESSSVPPIINALEIYLVKDFSSQNLANNNLTGSVSNELLQKQSDGLLSLNVGQNPNLCASTSCISQSTDTRKKENNAVIAVVASIAGILLLLVIIAAFIIFLQRKQYGSPCMVPTISKAGGIPMLSTMQLKKSFKKGETTYLALLQEESISEREDVPPKIKEVIEENKDVMPPELPKQLPPRRKMDDNIELELGAKPPISKPYRMSAISMVEGDIVHTIKEGLHHDPLAKKHAARNIILGKRRSSIKGSELESKQRQYSFNEVVKMTNNFDRILGRGGFGTVYHGFIEDIQVAVKMFSLSSVHGYQQFVAEVKLLMRVHHRNLTSLIGYCNEETNIGLIYEYMANGNLDEHLSGKNNRRRSLNWEDRLRIALDAAQGLEYLHNGCKPPIIHRDVKCTNILLNENLHAKLADFGLSKCFAADGDTHVSTIVAGTPGYLDPEYTTSNRLTEKSDVYSFGVVLLRIITGQPVVMVREDMIHHISQRINTMVTRGDITKIVDSRLQKDFDSNSAWRAVEIAMTSVSAISVERPYMSDIVKELKECLAAELARKHTSCDLQNEDLVGQVSLNLISTDITPIAR